MSTQQRVADLRVELAEAERGQEQEARSAAKAEADKLNEKCRQVKDSLLALQGQINRVEADLGMVGTRASGLEQQLAQLAADLESEPFPTAQELERSAHVKGRLEAALLSARQERDQLHCRLGLLKLDASRSMVRLQQLDFMLSDARARAAGVKVGAPEQGGVFTIS